MLREVADALSKLPQFFPEYKKIGRYELAGFVSRWHLCAAAAPVLPLLRLVRALASAATGARLTTSRAALQGVAPGLERRVPSGRGGPDAL